MLPNLIPIPTAASPDLLKGAPPPLCACMHAVAIYIPTNRYYVCTMNYVPPCEPVEGVGHPSLPPSHTHRHSRTDLQFLLQPCSQARHHQPRHSISLARHDCEHTHVPVIQSIPPRASTTTFFLFVYVPSPKLATYSRYLAPRYSRLQKPSDHPFAALLFSASPC